MKRVKGCVTAVMMDVGDVEKHDVALLSQVLIKCQAFRTYDYRPTSPIFGYQMVAYNI
jgi:hypothetical protein